MAIYTTGAAAGVLKCSGATVLRHAKRLGLGVNVRGAIVLTPEEVERIRPEIKAIGNPNMVKDNDLWKLGKKRRKTKKGGQ